MKSVKPITMEMVDSWCNGVEDAKIGSIRSILQAFRKACHYGEDQGDKSAPKFSAMSGSVLDKVMHFVLKNMDGVLRRLLSAPSFGGKKETISELMITKSWKRHAFPSLLRKYVKALLHTWGIYKAYLVNCKLSKSISGSKLKHIQFLGNCVRELYGLDPQSAYRHAFVFIRQLAVILKGALTERGPKKKTKGRNKAANQQKKQIEKSYQKVYDWQYIFCLELWTSVVCECSSEEEFRPLAYLLTQIIHGVACLVPSARYLPRRQENSKTRAFQEACIYSVVDELSKHLAQWSYSIAFFEMSFIPLVRLRSFRKTIKADRFRKEIKDLVHQIEANVEFAKPKRAGIAFSPNDPAVESSLQTEKKGPVLSPNMFLLCTRKRRTGWMLSMRSVYVIVGVESSTFSRRLSEAQKQQEEQDDDEGTIAFSKNWLTEKKKPKTVKEKIKKRAREDDDVATVYRGGYS
ncbi:hypothetical protein ACP70R_021061 [Stipagrostis hirtigluma subsp. patula]